MKKYECVIQDGPKDCGVCALLTIIKTHGGLVSKEYLRTLTNTDSNGVNALSLLEAGKKIGFSTEGVKGDVLDIEDKYLPCIAHVVIDNKYKHFVVIHKIDRRNGYIIVADPSRGILKIDIDKFRAISTNYYLFFIQNKVLPIMKDNNMIKNKIQSYIIDNKNIFIFIIILSFLFTILNVIISFNFQFIIDKAIGLTSIKNLYLISYIFIFIYSLKIISEYIRQKLMIFISHKLNYILISDSMNHILSLPHLFYKNRTTGEILSRISDLDELKDIVCEFILTIFVDLIITIFTLISIFSINFELSIYFLLIILIYSIIIFLYNRILYDDIKKIKEENSKVNSILIELINASNTIKSLNILEKVKEEFSIIYNNYLLISFNFTKKLNNKNTIDHITINLISLITFVIGGGLVINGKLNLSSLITFNSIVLYNTSSLKNILNFDILVKKTKVIVERINELLNIKEEKIHFDLNPLKNINGDIIIKNLSYKYGDNYVINNLSVIFKKSSKILITGDSGCGKSTLAKILSGFISVERNKIFIGSYDVNDINLWNLREEITYVSQDEYVFNNTLFENMNIKKSRDKNKIIDVCKMFLLEDITNKNKSGYNMILEENANNLSGGERQRVILARTFLKNSRIYILDETFSEINIEKERIILKNIFEKYKDRTIIVISHRFDNNDLFDNVYRMTENGIKSF